MQPNGYTRLNKNVVAIHGPQYKINIRGIMRVYYAETSSKSGYLSIQTDRLQHGIRTNRAIGWIFTVKTNKRTVVNTDK